MVRVRCPSCGNTFAVTGSAPVCPSCGFAGRPAPSQASPTGGVAPGEPLIVPLDAPELGHPPAPPTARGRRTLAILVLVLVLLLVGGAVAYVLMKRPFG